MYRLTGSILALLSLSLLAALPAQALQDERGNAEAEDATYEEEAILDQANEFLGSGTEGLAKAIEKAFADLGRPNAYIMGNEGSGAFFVGGRVGNGTLNHKIEGTREVHWIGPSIGFDAGANVSKVFALVYNLYDTEEIFRRYPAIEGSAYFVGGITMSYHQRGDVIIVPIRLGGGLRLGANLNYIKVTKSKTYFPF